MEVYFIRHGETYGNLERFHQGWGNVALTETGILQAKALGEAISVAELKFDRYISSDIHRVKQTASIIFEGTDGIKFEYDARLREINNTVLEGQRSADLRKKFGEEYKENCRKLEYTAYGGESAKSMLDRTASFLASLEEDKKSEKIAVITHGGVVHAILSHVLKMPLYLPLLKIDNCSVTKFIYDNKNADTHSWQLAYMNLRVDITRGGFAF